MLRLIGRELKAHAPFTGFGALTGVVIMIALVLFRVPQSTSNSAFWTLHPLHVLLSALATASMYRLKDEGTVWRTILIGYAGSIGIATLSDSIIPFIGEWILGLPDRAIHLGFIEKWWLVNPLALAGTGIGYVRPRTKLPHAGHVLLSTWASLFHMHLAMNGALPLSTAIGVFAFLFLAVWVPCCTSDIVFPLLFVRPGDRPSAVMPMR
jgi:hypothetical protein